MKKFITAHYSLIMIIFFIIYNILIRKLEISGIFYQIIMILFIICNLILLILFKKEIKWKIPIISFSLLVWIFSKDIFQLLFLFSNVIALIVIGFFEKNNSCFKLFAIFMVILFYFGGGLILFYFAIFRIFSSENIYDNTHYLCDNNHEIYAYSAGGIDKYHYVIYKRNKILYIDNFLSISYNDKNEVSENEYYHYLDNHQCKLIHNKK